MRTVLALALLAGTLSFGTRVRADNASAATELFRQGRDALEAKDYATAAGKFEESLRLEPHVGTLISLAECEEATGRLASARAHWQQAVDLARGTGDKRESFASGKLAAIDPRVPRLTLRRGPNPPEGLAVRRDDLDVGPASLEAALPVEVGVHTIVVSAKGFAAKALTVEVKEGESREVVVEPGPPLPPPSPPPEPPPTPVVVPPAPQRPAPASPLRPIAVAVGGLGVVALGVGTYLGVQVLEAKNQPAGTCPPSGCDSAGNARNSALTEGDWANVAFASAGVLLAAATVMWFVAPTNHKKTSDILLTPKIGFGPRGVTIEGRF